MAIEPYLAFCWDVKASDHVDSSGFDGAGWPHQCDKFAFPYIKAQALERLDFCISHLIDLPDIIKLYNAFFHLIAFNFLTVSLITAFIFFLSLPAEYCSKTVALNSLSSGFNSLNGSCPFLRLLNISSMKLISLLSVILPNAFHVSISLSTIIFFDLSMIARCFLPSAVRE